MPPFGLLRHCRVSHTGPSLLSILEAAYCEDAAKVMITDVFVCVNRSLPARKRGNQPFQKYTLRYFMYIDDVLFVKID